MILLTKLNGTTFFLNPLLIEQFHECPDTTITLITGRVIVVKDSATDIRERIEVFLSKLSLLHVTSHQLECKKDEK